MKNNTLVYKKKWRTDKFVVFVYTLVALMFFLQLAIVFALDFV